MPKGVALTPEQRAAAAARLAIGRQTALANRRAAAARGEVRPQSAKQQRRQRKATRISAAKHAVEKAAIDLAVTAALSPVRVHARDYGRDARSAALPRASLTPQEAAANARAHKGQPVPRETAPTAAASPTPAMSADDRLAYYRLRLENKFALWKPYPKQREFLAMGAEKRERMLRGGNKTGKTYTGAGEVVAHLTGRYPDWWTGIRFDRPTLVWSGGADGIAVRDGPQTLLCGLPGDRSQLGTGMIPRDLIVGDPPAARSAPNGIDSVIVRHVTGGSSKVVFKTYAQGDGHGTGSWEGPYVDAIWLDEEAPMAVYSEALARLTGQGRIFTTFTPKLGYSQLVTRFLREVHDDRGVVQITLAEAEHFTAEEKRQRAAGYQAHERAFREFGDPSLGEGAVFTTPEADLRVNLALGSVPTEWRKIWGLDFGSNHPFAAVLWAFDRENDIDYVLYVIKMTSPPNTPAILGHCEAIKRVCALAPVAWPHDGHVAREGEALKDIYKQNGLKMLDTHALNAQGNHYTQPGIDAMDERMQQRRLLVRNSPENERLFEEYRNYHRKVDPHTRKSSIVKDFDDVMSAMRIGFIRKSDARPVVLGGPLPPQPRKPPIRDFDLFTGFPIQPGAL